MSNNEEYRQRLKDLEDEIQALYKDRATKPTGLMEEFVNKYTEINFSNMSEAARNTSSQSKTPEQSAMKWMKNPWVLKMIERNKLRQRTSVEEKSLCTKPMLIDKMLKTHELAISEGKFDAAIKALIAVGSEFDTFVPKTVTTNTTTKYSITEDKSKLKESVGSLMDLLEKAPRKQQVIDSKPSPFNSEIIDLEE